MTQPDQEDIQKVTQIFKMLGDPTRLKILLSLEEGERNVTSIAEQVWRKLVYFFADSCHYRGHA